MEIDLTRKQKKSLSKFNFFKKPEPDKTEVRNIVLTALGLGLLPFIAFFLGISISKLMDTICYVFAFFFAFKATMFLRPGLNRPLKDPITLYMVAVVLVCLPSMMDRGHINIHASQNIEQLSLDKQSVDISPVQSK